MGSSVVAYYKLSDVDVVSLDSLVSELVAARYDATTSAFYDDAWSFVPRLPLALREFLAAFRSGESAGACHISGFSVDESRLGPTPESLDEARATHAGSREEFIIGLIATCLGEAFSWSTLQSGRLVLNVMPVRGEESAQSGHGSRALLDWHIEDAFHPYRADYLLLLGLRNPGGAPTFVASVRDANLSADTKAILGQPRFHILPDDEHIAQLAAHSPAHPSLMRMLEMRDEPPLVPVLFGDVAEPYICVNPPFMRCRESDSDAESALSELVMQLEAVVTNVVVNPGDMLVVDNYIAVHGRRPFTPQYDGGDRWLKKALVTRDLRKSRASRASAQTRVII